jgi:zinc protease
MRKATIIIFVLFLSTGALAQNSRPSVEVLSHRAGNSAALPTVDSVLKKYVKAIGGRATIEKINSRVLQGTFELASLAGVKGSIEIYEKAPNKQVAILNIPGLGQEAEGFNGEIAWELDPDSGVVHEKSGLELAAARREANFYQEIKFKELYTRLTIKGIKKVGAGQAYVIEAVPAEGSAEHFYFDTLSGLLVRHDSIEEGAEGLRAVEEYYADYRAVDGLLLPFTLHQVSPGTDFTIKLTGVKQNVAVEDSKFNKPEEQ